MSEEPDTAQHGRLFLMIGPPGAGKQALIDTALHSAQHLQRAPLVVSQPESHPRRILTAISPALFNERKRQGEFLLSWDAEGTRYALPHSTRTRLHAGQHMIAAGDAASLGEARETLPQLVPLYIHARADVLRRRIVASGRFEEHEIDRIINEEQRHRPRDADIRMIDTSGSISAAAADIRAILDWYGVTDRERDSYRQPA